MSWIRCLVVGVVCVLCMSSAPKVSADGDEKRIVLHDGSAIIATVRSLEDGVYTLESPTLGKLRIPQKRVRRIEEVETATPAAAAPVHDLQLRMLSDPNVMAALMQLQQSPEMQAVLQDPEILRAVASGDLESLEKNPKMRKLMQDPAVRSLTQQLARPAPGEAKR